MNMNYKLSASKPKKL